MKFFHKANIIGGGIITMLSTIFGQYWFLFAGFLVLNAVDYMSGYIKAKYFLKNESSAVGAKGVFKKVWYWVVIAIAFYISLMFVKIGDVIAINLSFMVLFGWFTLATYTVNEIRSILENCVQMGIKVPLFLIKGLEITEQLINKDIDTDDNEQAEKQA